MKEKHGQHIRIVWDGYSNIEYIRGHVSLDDARKIFDTEWGQGHTDGIVLIKRVWARWTPASHCSDFDMMLNVFDNKSRGAFAITEVRFAFRSKQ